MTTEEQRKQADQVAENFNNLVGHYVSIEKLNYKALSIEVVLLDTPVKGWTPLMYCIEVDENKKQKYENTTTFNLNQYKVSDFVKL